MFGVMQIPLLAAGGSCPSRQAYLAMFGRVTKRVTFFGQKSLAGKEHTARKMELNTVCYSSSLLFSV